MKLIKIIIHIAILYSFFLVGGWIQTTLNLFIPGSIIGMLLFFLALKWKFIQVRWVEEGTEWLIRYMPLLFLPVTIGVMEHFALFAGKGFLLIVIVLISTAIVMVSAGKVSEWAAGRKERAYE